MLNMPVGISSFEKIRKGGSYYVDKTNIITDLVTSPDEVTLFARPRRFGKTLVMRMLESFFNIKKDSKYLFDGLKISENTELCNAYMNQYPTIFITLKDVYGDNFEIAFDILRDKVSTLCRNFSYLSESDKLDHEERELFNR